MSHSQNTRGRIPAARGSSGFTLLEILVALCVVLIALVPLIHLHVTSIRMMDSGSRMARATLLANDRLAEVLARDVPELGKSTGRVEDETGHTVYRWTSLVTEAAVPELETVRLAGIRQVHVEVAWQEGERDVAVSLDSLVRILTRGPREIRNDPNDNKSDKKSSLSGSGV